MNRRNFLQLSTAAAALPLLTPSLWPEAAKQFPIGLQLSTLVKHKVDQAELMSNLRQISAIGFQEVEPWHAAYSIPAEQLRKDINDAGMTVSSGHFDRFHRPDGLCQGAGPQVGGLPHAAEVAVDVGGRVSHRGQAI
jgi:hypothetical protein